MTEKGAWGLLVPLVEPHALKMIVGRGATYLSNPRATDARVP